MSVLSRLNKLWGSKKPREARRNYRPTMEFLEDRTVLAGNNFLVFGSQAGGLVTVFAGGSGLAGSPGRLLANFQPFPGFNGAIRVATADITGDGIEDLIVGTGPGASAVRVFEGQNLRLGLLSSLTSFIAYPGNNGVFVAGGRFNQVTPLLSQVVVGTDSGVQAQVRTFSIAGGTGVQLQGSSFGSFNPFGNFNGGVRVSAGNYQAATATDELVVATGPGGGVIRILTDTGGGAPFQFAALQPFGASYTGGLFVATAGVGVATNNNLIVGSGGNIAGTVQVVNIDPNTGATFTASSFQPYGGGYTGAVSVGAAQVDGFGNLDLYTGTLATGTTTQSRAFTFAQTGLQQSIDFGGIFPFGANNTGGVFAAP